MGYLQLTKCRLCDGDFSSKILSLKSSPPANELYSDISAAKACQRFPLDLVICQECGHVQLAHIVSPDRLFSNYVYKSGTSAFFRQHFYDLAKQIADQVPNGSTVFEIGSNDGTLIECLNENGLLAIGLEPSELLVNESVTRGLNVYKGFLDNKFSSDFVKNHGKAKVVVANNVFAHIHNMQQAIIDIGLILDDSGLFIFEVAHLLALVKNGYFDTIYHEHMSYHSVFTLKQFLEKNGFEILKVEKISAHGGSIRVTSQKFHQGAQVINHVEDVINEEIRAGITSEQVLELIGGKIDSARIAARKLIKSFDGREFIFGYGAPAKVVTFLSEMGFESLNIQLIADDNPDKQGKFLPGSGFSIESLDSVRSRISSTTADVVCLIFPWNLGQELIEKLSQFMPQGSKAISFFPTISIKEF